MAQDQPDIRSQLLRSLMRKVANDPYPSTSMMDTVEELLTSDMVGDYVNILMERIDGDRFPSVAMIDRVRNLAIG